MYKNNSLCESNIRYKIFEKKEYKTYAEKSWLGKALSWPSRATRKAKVEYLFKSYKNKLEQDINNAIQNFNEQLPERLNLIKNKVEQYLKEYNTIKNKGIKSNDPEYKLQIRKLENLSRNYLNAEQIYSGERTKKLEKYIDDSINNATKELEDIIDNIGEHIKVDFSNKTKFQLKNKWAQIKQQIEEEAETKKLEILDNPIVKEIEDLKASVDNIIQNEGGYIFNEKGRIINRKGREETALTPQQKRDMISAKNILSSQIANFLCNYLPKKLRNVILCNDIYKCPEGLTKKIAEQMVKETSYNAPQNSAVRSFLKDRYIINERGEYNQNNIDIFCDSFREYLLEYDERNSTRLSAELSNKFKQSPTKLGPVMFFNILNSNKDEYEYYLDYVYLEKNPNLEFDRRFTSTFN